MKLNNWLIRCGHRQDYGSCNDWYVCILNTGKHVPNPLKCWSLLQVSVSYINHPSWPYLQIKSGTGSVVSILFWGYKFGLDVGILERTWDWMDLVNI
jgi:hypothetical protein